MTTLRIEGLTVKQKMLADVIWAIDSQENVEAFILTLPPKDSCEARTVMNLMIWAMLDQEDSTHLAEPILQRIMKL